MPELILHHFAPSPFAEKVRLTFGLKQLAWSAVEIPMIMPKPDLMPLTGGYRRTPVLQIGAEIYCDSKLIMNELDRRYPEPSLFPQGGAGLLQALAAWSDSVFFEPGAGLSMGLNEGLPEDLLNDRKEFFKFMDFDSLKTSLPHLYSQFLAQLQLLERELKQGNPYLTGELVSGIDILGYFPLWMSRGNFPQVESWLDAFPTVLEWEQRMQKIGHGHQSEVSANHALEIARQANPVELNDVSANPEGLEIGQHVLVQPTDYGAVPVYGELRKLNHEVIVLQRVDEKVGTINNHFPRSGFEVKLVEPKI